MQQNLLYNENSSLKRELDHLLHHGSDAKVVYASIDEVKNISPEDFIRDYVQKQKPLVIRKAADAWAAIEKWNFEFFANRYSDLEVVANLYDVQAKKKLNFRQLVEILTAKKYDSPTYLQEWWFQENCKELLDDVVLPEHFADDYNKKLLGFHNNTLWIGQKGAFTPIHQDTTFANVWSAQIMGRKEWVLLDKNARIYPSVDGSADFARFFSEDQVLKTILEPGDILYMPHKWWHRAQTLEHAISLNTFYITQDIVQQYLRDVLRIPLAALLNRDLLQEYDPMRYNICWRRSEILTKMLGLNPENILGVDTSGQAVEGIYGKRAS